MSLPAKSADATCIPAGMISVDQARAFLLERARALVVPESVPVAAALGRVLASPVAAGMDVPGYDNSQMDGYALRTVDLARGGGTRLAVTQRIAAGHAGETVGAGEAARIFTGAPLPPGADAVVIQEACRVEGGHVWVPAGVTPGENVRPRGNNVAAGEVVMRAGTRLRAQEMGVAAALGLTHLPVVCRPRVAVLSSGSELVAPGEPLAPGCIYNSNTSILLGLLAQCGCEVVCSVTVPDEFGATRDALLHAAAAADVVVSSGGVSVGDEDHMKAALADVGSLEMWRVAVKPGKPLTYGRIGEADYLGLPGNPVSVLCTFALFVQPFVLRRLGVGDVTPRFQAVRAGFDWPKAGTRREYLRARLEAGGDLGPVARLFPRQGSDVLASAVWADGLVEIGEGATVAAGEPVPYASFRELLG